MFLRTLLIILFIPLHLLASGGGPLLKSTNAGSVLDFVFFDANRIGAWITNEGELTSFRVNGNAGMEWPRDSGKNIIFHSGIWIAGIVDSLPRTAVAAYSTEFRGGTYESYPDNSDDPRFRIYSLDRQSGPGTLDWDSWPSSDGAPTDSNGDPLLLGDRSYWSVFHDADTAAHTFQFKSDPLGIEVRMSSWGYDQPGAYGDIMFLNFQLFNKGDNFIEDVFLATWHDVDIGQATDDLFGTDTLLQMHYVYNDGTDNVYGAAPPAIGFKLLRGPAVPSIGDNAIAFGKSLPDYSNIGLHASAFLFGGAPPGLGDPSTPSEVYFLMQGLDALGILKSDDLGNITRYAYTGDPVTGEGWILTSAEDLRGIGSYGPFNMAPGDSVELIAAVIIAQDTSALQSIAKLREISRNVQEVFEKDFQIYDVSLLSPLGGERFSDSISVTWDITSVDSTPIDLNIYLESFLGERYLIADAAPNSGSFTSYIDSIPDGRYILLIEAFDKNLGEIGFFQTDYSDSLFTIDNPGNSAPFLELTGPRADILSGETEILWRAIDFEDSTLFMTIEYSVDDGKHWLSVADEIPNSGSYLWDSWIFPNSETALISLSTSDENTTVRVVSELFELHNQRQMNIEHVFANVIGNGQGPMVLNVVDSTLLTDHNYTISFRESVSGELIYDIFDLTEGQIKVSSAYETFGPETPLFDGIRFSMFNFDDTLAWKTDWINIVGEKSSYEIRFFKGLRERELTDDDYEVRFLGENADSTEGGKMLPFQIWNVSLWPQRKVTLLSGLGAEWRSGDFILFKEADTITWIVKFEWRDSDIAPQEGDVLKLYTGRPHHAGDLLLFTVGGAPIGVDLNDIKLPLNYELSQNYPNPFNPVTRIEYSLPISSEVSLIIYNLRGQEVARLIDGRQVAGVHTITWDASNSSSGIYFYRLIADEFVQTKKMVLLK